MAEHMSEKELNKLINMLELSRIESEVSIEESLWKMIIPTMKGMDGCWSGRERYLFRTRYQAEHRQ